MLTVSVACTQLSRLLLLSCSGCATYPMFVVGVTCTLSSRSFYLLLLRPGQVQCFDLRSCRVFATLELPSSIPSCQSATVHLRPRLCQGQCYTVSAFSPILRQNPVGFSVLSHVSASAICSVPAQPGFPFGITVYYCYLGICFFAYPCSPTCFFVPSLGLFCCRSTLHLHLLPSRLRSDFFCPSQLLPFFSLIVSLWPDSCLGFLSFVDFVDFSSLRSSSPLYRPLSFCYSYYYYAGLDYDRRSLSPAVQPFKIAAFSFVPLSFVYVPVFTFYVLLLFFSDWIYMVYVYVGLWILDLEYLCLVLRLWQRCNPLVTLESPLYVNSRGSTPSPVVSFIASVVV